MNKHYEIVFLVNADQSDQVPVLVQRYRSLVEEHNGVVHRYEDWGRRSLAYPINKASKAHYILLNIECNDEVLNELNHNFRFNDAIIRSLVLKRRKAITTPSVMLQAIQAEMLAPKEYKYDRYDNKDKFKKSRYDNADRHSSFIATDESVEENLTVEISEEDTDTNN